MNTTKWILLVFGTSALLSCITGVYEISFDNTQSIFKYHESFEARLVSGFCGVISFLLALGIQIKRLEFWYLGLVSVVAIYCYYLWENSIKGWSMHSEVYSNSDSFFTNMLLIGIASQFFIFCIIFYWLFKSKKYFIRNE